VLPLEQVTFRTCTIILENQFITVNWDKLEHRNTKLHCSVWLLKNIVAVHYILRAVISGYIYLQESTTKYMPKYCILSVSIHWISNTFYSVQEYISNSLGLPTWCYKHLRLNQALLFLNSASNVFCGLNSYLKLLASETLSHRCWCCNYVWCMKIIHCCY